MIIVTKVTGIHSSSRSILPVDIRKCIITNIITILQLIPILESKRSLRTSMELDLVLGLLDQDGDTIIVPVHRSMMGIM